LSQEKKRKENNTKRAPFIEREPSSDQKYERIVLNDI